MNVVDIRGRGCGRRRLHARAPGGTFITNDHVIPVQVPAVRSRVARLARTPCRVSQLLQQVTPSDQILRRRRVSRSIRQIPGAFDKTTHRVAGRTLTLDQIEQTVLPEFHDPRLFLALGRGALGGGRLRSEAFAGATLEAQLVEVAAECVTRNQCLQIDRVNNKMAVSPIFAWRRCRFVRLPFVSGVSETEGGGS